MPADYTVTIQRVITTEIKMTAASAADARRYIEKYGVTEAITDMASQDTDVSSKIKSVKAA